MHFELIFCLLTSPKCVLLKFKKAVFQVFRNLTFDLSLLTLNFELLTLKFLTHISQPKVKVQISKPLNHRFFNLTQVAFWAIQEAENERNAIP